jgi:hypothetical protein
MSIARAVGLTLPIVLKENLKKKQEHVYPPNILAVVSPPLWSADRSWAPGLCIRNSSLLLAVPGRCGDEPTQLVDGISGMRFFFAAIGDVSTFPLLEGAETDMCFVLTKKRWNSTLLMPLYPFVLQTWQWK